MVQCHPVGLLCLQMHLLFGFVSKSIILHSHWSPGIFFFNFPPQLCLPTSTGNSNNLNATSCHPNDDIFSSPPFMRVWNSTWRWADAMIATAHQQHTWGASSMPRGCSAMGGGGEPVAGAGGWDMCMWCMQRGRGLGLCMYRWKPVLCRFPPLFRKRLLQADFRFSFLLAFIHSQTETPSFPLVDLVTEKTTSHCTTKVTLFLHTMSINASTLVAKKANTCVIVLLPNTWHK